MRQKILVCGWYGAGNTGDEAILSSILKDFSQSDITVMAYNPEAVRNTYGVPAIDQSILNMCQIIKSMRDTDLFILGGGGLIQDKSSIYNLFRWLSKIVLAACLKKRTALYCVGVGPLSTAIGKQATKAVLRLVETIIVRDEASRTLLTKIGISADKVIVDIDPAMFLAPLISERVQTILAAAEADRPLVGFCLNHWFYTHSWLPVKIALKLKRENPELDRLAKAVAQAADHLISEYGAEIFFIPLWSGRDEQVANAVIARMKMAKLAYLIEGRYQPEEIIGLLSRMKLVVGMRLHSVIFAAGAGVPVVALQYAPKVSGFMDMVGLADYGLAVECLGGGKLIDMIDKAWMNMPQIKDKLRNAKISYHDRHMQIIRRLERNS